MRLNPAYLSCLARGDKRYSALFLLHVPSNPEFLILAAPKKLAPRVSIRTPKAFHRLEERS